MHPQLAQRFPGRVDQLAQIVDGLPPDVFEDLMLGEALHAQGGVPGGLDGIDAEDNVENLIEVNFPAVGVEPGASLAREQVGIENQDSEDETEDDSTRVRLFFFSIRRGLCDEHLVDDVWSSTKPYRKDFRFSR